MNFRTFFSVMSVSMWCMACGGTVHQGNLQPHGIQHANERPLSATQQSVTQEVVRIQQQPGYNGPQLIQTQPIDADYSDYGARYGSDEGNGGENDMRAMPKPSGPDTVAPGFQIQISGAEDERLNGKYRVGFDGTLLLPYDTSIEAAGLSEKKLKQTIVQAYSRYFQTAPVMQISVADKKYWIDVRGLVEKPGRYLVSRTSSLDELIGKAEGLQRAGDQGGEPLAEYVKIEQFGEDTVVKLTDYYSGIAQIDPKWFGGETVFFLSGRTLAQLPVEVDGKYVHFIGEINSPGEYYYKPGAGFYHYFVKAGGPTDRADLSMMYLIRENGSEIVEFSLEEKQSLPEIQGGDIVLVRAENPTAVEKQSKLVSEIATVIGTVATIILLFITV